MKTMTILNGGRHKAILYTALFAACAVLAPTAAAQCSNMSPRGSVAWLDELPPAGPGQAQTPLVKAQPRVGANPSIVGLWKTTFTSGGQVVDQAFEAFHSDGTEIMVDTSAPASDNVCIGVWARTDGLTFKLNHPSWTFDDKGNLNGTAAIKMDLTIDPNGNSFIGTFTVDVFDLSGNTLLHLAGTVAGKRVTVD